MPRKKQNARDQWLWTVLSEKCDLPGTSRLVAVALSRFMDFETLDGAFPGPARLAGMTGLNESTVKRHLAFVCEAGWLKQVEKGGSYGLTGRHASEYRGRYPWQDTPG